MKKGFVILLTITYLTMVSGISISNFYCCGKLKETHIYTYAHDAKDCKGDKSDAGCCDTKTTLLKIKDGHTTATEIQFNNYSTTFIAIYDVFIGSDHASDLPLIIGFEHSPPIVSKNPIYISVNNFRI